MPSKELEAKSTTPLAGLVNTPTKPLPTPATFHNQVLHFFSALLYDIHQ